MHPKEIDYRNRNRSLFRHFVLRVCFAAQNLSFLDGYESDWLPTIILYSRPRDDHHDYHHPAYVCPTAGPPLTIKCLGPYFPSVPFENWELQAHY